MKIIGTPIDGVEIIETTPLSDQRGSFARWFCAKELAPVLNGRSIVQINHSRTAKKGSIRGMHYQKPPHGEMKFVRCIRGKVWDVALDLREGSPSFLQWQAVELTPENGLLLAIPERCAHGFQVIEPDSELLYLHTAYYEPSAEGGVHFADPLTMIQWPLPPADVSERDSSHPPLTHSFRGI
jgi:dTDP-4-dehydrorhamnose 3,5-epimerase